MTLNEIREASARGYCTDRNSKKILDADLLEDIAQEVFKADRSPNLGCATTRELLTEITARFDNLDYRTIVELLIVNPNP